MACSSMLGMAVPKEYKGIEGSLFGNYSSFFNFIPFFEMNYLEILANEIPWIMAPAALIAVLIAISSIYKLLIQQKDPVFKIIIVTITIAVALGTTMMKFFFM